MSRAATTGAWTAAIDGKIVYTFGLVVLSGELAVPCTRNPP